VDPWKTCLVAGEQPYAPWSSREMVKSSDRRGIKNTVVKEFLEPSRDIAILHKTAGLAQLYRTQLGRGVGELVMRSKACLRLLAAAVAAISGVHIPMRPMLAYR
jgi:hypothetical protein